MGCLSSRTTVVSPQPPRTPTPTPTPPRTPTPPPPRTPTPPPPPRQNTEDFASDTVDIQYDDRKDKINIPVQENNDPEIYPPPENNNIKVDNHFFEDKEFQLASDDADIRELDNVQDDTSLGSFDAASDDVVVVPRAPGKHVPKLSFTDIDEHARQAKERDAESFQSLIDYLKNPLDRDYPETKLARAIVVWLSQQDVDNTKYGDADVKSPRGLLQHLKQKTMTYATCYVILCRSAGLTCTLIKGIVKAAGYEPGDTKAPSSPWTAVLADGAWRIVHPFWICRALYGHSLAGWVKVEQDGKSTNQRTRASEGVARNAFQDNYFMPKPEHFIHECFPDDTRCELLPKNKIIYSKKEFFELPYLLPPFFGLGLELISEQKCHLHTNNGLCQVQVKAKGSNGHMLVLTYELFAKDSPDFNPENIQRMVFNSRSNEYFTFDIRFPCTGIFKLVIYGGPYKSPLLRLCEFKITCGTPMPGQDLLPLSGGNIGFGPGPVTFEAGLFLPSRPNGFITVPKNKKTTQISFYVKKEVLKTTEFSAVLVDGKSTDRAAFKKCVNAVTISETRRLNIIVSLPQEGEFGLQIESTNDTRRVACNYLLSTTSQRIEKANQKNAKEKLRKQVESLEKAKPESWKNQIATCEDLIENCRRQRVDPSDEDLCMGETLAELYRYKNALREGQNRRNIKILKAVLQLAKRYKNEMAIRDEVKQTERFMERLVSLSRLSDEARGLREAFSYLASDTISPDVEAVYRAVLFLLRCSHAEIKTLEQVKSKLGSAETVTRRLEDICTGEITRVNREQASREIEKVREADWNRAENEHVKALYDWVVNILAVYGRRK